MILVIYLKSGQTIRIPGLSQGIVQDPETGDLKGLDLRTEVPYALNYLDPTQVAAIVTEPRSEGEDWF